MSNLYRTASCRCCRVDGMTAAEGFVSGRAPPMKTLPPRLNGRRLLSRGLDRRTGRRMRQIRRLLIAADGRPVSTRQMLEYVYPHLDLDKPVNRWRWRKVRYSASRFAERVMPRTRPLRWRLKSRPTDVPTVGR